MSEELRRHVEDYLRLRRALGFKLTRHGPLLAKFIDYLDATGATGITTELAVAFAQLPPGVQPIVWAQRLSMVRGFARYLQAIDPATEIPPHHIFAPRYQRPAPYLWQETEVLDLMAAARRLRPALCALTYQTLFGLLWCSGMRIGETIGLQRGDVDLSAGVITVRHAKCGRSRLVPLQQSTTDALAHYATGRDRLCPQPRSDAFFVSGRGTTLIPQVVGRTFHRLAVKTGLHRGCCVTRWAGRGRSGGADLPPLRSAGTAPVVAGGVLSQVGGYLGVADGWAGSGVPLVSERGWTCWEG